jgi:hypothetical protein
MWISAGLEATKTYPPDTTKFKSDMSENVQLLIVRLVYSGWTVMAPPIFEFVVRPVNEQFWKLNR